MPSMTHTQLLHVDLFHLALVRLFFIVVDIELSTYYLMCFLKSYKSGHMLKGNDCFTVAASFMYVDSHAKQPIYN